MTGFTTLEQLVVWGDNTNQQISNAPHEHLTGLVPGGPDQSLAVRPDGTLVLWGNGSIPALHFGPYASFQESVLGAAIGLTHFVAIRKDHSLVAWGNLSDHTDAQPPAALRAVAVAVGANHGFAITLTGELSAPWGSGAGAVPAPKGKFIKIRARSNYTIAINEDGRLYGWGGIFSTAIAGWDLWQRDKAGYHYVDGPYVDLAPGPLGGAPEPHVLALDEGGHVDGWGANDFEQATGAPPGVVFKAIDAGSGYSIGLDADGRLHHWGNRYADLVVKQFDLSPRHRKTLGDVPMGRFKAICAGSRHAAALTLPRTLGANAFDRTVKQPSLEASFTKPTATQLNE